MALLKCRTSRGYEVGMSITDCLLLWIRSNVIEAEADRSMNNFMHTVRPVLKASIWTNKKDDTSRFQSMHRWASKARRAIQTVTVDLILEKVDMVRCKETGLCTWTFRYVAPPVDHTDGEFLNDWMSGQTIYGYKHNIEQNE